LDSYKNAKDVLPERLLKAVQRYLQGETIYIPVSGTRRRWGERSGTRAALAKRNAQIRQAYQNGSSLDELSSRYHLSIETLQKILRKKS